MDFSAILATLNDLPTTFTRPAAWYTQLVDAMGCETALETEGGDDTINQAINFGNAQDGWIDIYGLLMGIPRNAGEGNIPYSARVEATLSAWVGTVPAVQVWLSLFALGGTVAENLSGLGYIITFPSTMSLTQIANFLASFNRIRPIGVPFTAIQGGGALYLGTIEYLGGGITLGTYLSAGASPSTSSLGANTLNAQPLLPTLFMTDPLLNPSLAPGLQLK